MAYLDQLLSQVLTVQPVGTDLGLRPGQAYASFYPSNEVNAPQYVTPNAYLLAQEGFRTNTLIYTLINKRANALAEAPLWVWNDTGEHPEEMPAHGIRKLLKRVNMHIGERMFWKITSIYRDIAGFAAWEIERNKLGEPIRLWIMRPDWCSFLRGEQKPMRAIRYQPWGLPPKDIAIEDILFFGNFDPLYPQIRFYSPTMSAMSQIGVDNRMTDFLADFVRHGAKFSGLLSVAQTIDQQTAEDYKRRFREAHGGTQNWSDPLVLGLGAKYESMQMNFKEMAFPELDARTETRICMAFEMSPILISAKVGLDRSTYSNYEQASKAWYNEWVNPQWQIVADMFGEQMIPQYHEDPELYYCEFNLNNIHALNEDRTVQADRARGMFKDGIARLNEAREEVGFDPIDGEEGEQFYKAPAPIAKTDNVPDAPKQNAEAAQLDKPAQPTQAEQDLQDEEVKHFRAFAKKRIKEGKYTDIPEYEFKYISQDRQAELVRQYATFDTGADKVLDGIKSALLALDKQQPKQEAQPINIAVHSYPGEPPTVNIENKAGDITTPAPLVTVVNRVETPQVSVTNTPDPKPRKARRAKLVKGDDGSITISEE